MLPRAVPLLLLAALCAALCRADSVSLDLGWRFFRGTPPGEPCTSPFNTNFTGQQCNGLTNGSAAASSQSECEALCCAQYNCEIWQWLGGGGAGAGCWYGQIPPEGCTGGSPWVSFANASRADAVPGWAAVAYDDSPAANWSVVDAPHDFIITGADETLSPYVDDRSLQGQAFIPKSVAVYRKHFQVPAAWQGTHIEVYIEGMYAASTYYLNGALLGSHDLGYTSAFFRLDNASLVYGAGSGDNVLAVYVDATSQRDTGWWYEGGGVFRHTFLTSSPSAAHVTPHGLHADVALSGGYAYPARATDGVTAGAATLLAFAEVEGDGAAAAPVTAAFTLYAADGATVAASARASGSAGPAGAPPAALSATLTLANASAWSVGRPYLYTLSVALSSGHTVNVSLGLRAVRFDADSGVYVNEQRVRFRAYCDHESFAATGMAVPDRVNLFRYQAMRGMGGNGRRFSHNPPAPALLDLADRLGLLTLDENRVFAQGLAGNMRDLVERDRNHPSVVFWSFCNEPGCNDAEKGAGTQPTEDFKYVTEIADGSRAVTGNMCIGWGSCPDMSQYLEGLNMSLQLDVQGFSHVDSAAFEQYHARWPGKPLVASECCSCETQRGEADDVAHNKSLVYYSEFNADCLAQQTQWALGLDYVAGSFVWTAFDYFGEPDAWPHVSSSFGSFDLAGFPKAAVYWYRSWWRDAVPASDAGRPPLPAAPPQVHIVEAWAPAPASPTRTIHVYTAAPYVRLSLNGGPALGTQPVPPFGYAKFTGVAYAPGVLLAEALAGDGATVLATHSRASWGAPAALRLTLDAPSPATGTGGALYLDGSDAALVRATIVDAAGNVCEDAAAVVAFAVSGGPGRVWGTGSGDPANQEPNHAPARTAYHGLVRAVVRVAQVSGVAGGGPGALALLAAVNVDAGAGGRSAPIVPLAGRAPPVIVVTATAPGLLGASLNISTSAADSDSVLAVAAASVQSAYTGE